MKIAISSGHGKHIRGARGSPVPPQLDERDQNVRVVDKVYDDLKKAGVGVVKFHDDVSTSQNENLNRIVNWHNAQTRDYDVSVHFNAFDHSAHGTEVLYVSQQALAKKVCDAICAAGGFTNRGAKKNTGLAFLNGTDKPAILIETCFCDHTGDSNTYNAKFAAICESIAESISGAQVPDESTPPEPVEPEPPGGSTPGAELVVHVTIEAPAGVIVAVDVRETTTGRKVEEAKK
jgi:N-acetylmuramoyl-L-alanine amidase